MLWRILPMLWVCQFCTEKDDIDVLKYQKQLIRFIWLVNLGLLVGLGYFIQARLLPEKQSPMVRTEKTQPASNVASFSTIAEEANDVQLDLIAGSGLFGKNSQAGLLGNASLLAETKKNPIPPKKFPLNVKLLGTVAGSLTNSFAVLEDLDAKQQDVYRVGDVIQEARLEKIFQNRIVVAYEGELWPLDVGLTERRNVVGKGTSSTQVGAETDLRQEGRIKDILMAMSDSEILVNTLASDNTVRALSQATEGLSFAAGQGSEGGIKLTGVAKSPVGRLIGLKEGDLIRSVNGHAVRNKRKAAQVLMKARKLGRAEFGIVRDHQEKTLSFKPGLW